MISIIIPVYNVAPFLDNCLQSVKNQTWKDWQCILVDDGSSDGSERICDEWRKRDKRFHVIHQENRGVSMARNKGVECAKGEYIAFIDSDDWVDKEYLADMISEVEKGELVLCGLMRQENGRIVNMVCPDNQMILMSETKSEKRIAKLIEQSLLFGPCVKLYKRSLIKSNHIRFPDNCSYGEDLQFNFQYLKYVNTIVCVNKSHYHYRFVPQSLSNILRLTQFTEDYEQWKIIKEFFEEKKLFNDFMKEVLYKRLWGIVYDGLFISHLIRNRYMYIKNILSIKDIDELGIYRHCFCASPWIKFAVIHRLTLFFYIYFLLNMYYKKSNKCKIKNT